MARPRCLILCKSVHHGNTAQVARALATSLGEDEVVGGRIGGQVVLAAPEEVPYTSLNACGLVGFGSGVYYGRMHGALFEWLGGLPDAGGPAMPAFVFSTSGLPLFAKLWHWPLKALLARKGFEVVGEFACRGFDTWGPLWFTGGLNWRHPDERDLERARMFARTLATVAPREAFRQAS